MMVSHDSLAGLMKMTFGLSALEALASGTPVVVSSRSALPEVVGPAGLAAEDDDAACAGAVEQILRRDVTDRRRRATWPSACRPRSSARSAPRAAAALLT
jgi:alpha-1,6-mannosyltransferase